MILSLKTDQPEATLALYDNKQEVAITSWQAHRTLSDTLLTKIEELLAEKNKTYQDLTGIIVFKGPGSFTGLRIGHTVANTLAYAQDIPIVTTEGNDWIELGLERLNNQENDQVALPEYGGMANITKPRK